MRSMMFVAVALQLAGCGAGVFACEQSADCIDGGVVGACQLDGWCSFPDAACPSGQRYGGHAGDGVAGTCVGEDGDATDGATSTSASGSGTVDSTSMGALTTTTTTTTMTTSEPATETSDPSATAGPTDPTIDPTGDGVCGDGVVQAGEDCDAGMDNANNGECLEDCRAATCGDGHVLDSVERCDGEVDDGQGEACILYGYAGGHLGCMPNCLDLDFAECIDCDGQGCNPYPACSTGPDCADGESCTLHLGAPPDSPGTCVLDCTDDGGGMCELDEICPPEMGGCVRMCGADSDCPDDMRCVPFELGGGCMW